MPLKLSTGDLTSQALEVYERLLRENESDPAELVISGELYQAHVRTIKLTV
jgi:hypothetical protein